MAIIQCPECGQNVSDKAKKCIHCGYPLDSAAENSNGTSQDGTNFGDSNYNSNSATENDTQSAAQNAKSGNSLLRVIGRSIVIIIAINVLTGAFAGDGILGSLFESPYYVAKHPSYSAITLQIDGYMHKSKSCCQKVADHFGAEVIQVKPNQKAGTNSYGQTLAYEDCFRYCSLCCY